MKAFDIARLSLAVDGDISTPRLTPARIDSLREALRRAENASVIVLTGGSASFCEGLDLQASLQPATDSVLWRFAELLMAIESSPQPVIAVVLGPALGGGVGLAAAADLVLATSAARFSLPEALMGLVPAVVFPTVAGRIGGARTRLLSLTGETLSAAEAHHSGLVDVLTENPEETLAKYCQRFQRMDPRSLGAIKRLAAPDFAVRRGYLKTAIAHFQTLAESAPTGDRIRRFMEGGVPWAEELA